ncbi:hypothetical protein FS837_011564 [Tulasnella sp. UAMH 9824]|nr:hypothetical protein FS837_011564 [Tulasnella sp. UAMH 9824]
MLELGAATNWIASLSVVPWKLLAATSFERQETTPKILFLPHEILLLIVDFLDDQSITRLVRTCHHLRNAMEPRLYRHVRARVYKTRRRNLLKPHFLHRTLVERPDFLPHILSYHGPLVPSVDLFDEIGENKKAELWRRMSTTTQQPVLNDEVFHEYLEKAKIIFSGTINIQELHFTDQDRFHMAEVLHPFDAPPSRMVNIKRLILDVRWCSSELAPILQSQPGLKHLDLSELGPGCEIQLHETDLPELESLRTSLQHAAQIIPGRPVKKLELVDNRWNHDECRPSWEQLAHSMCDITELVARTSRCRPLDPAGREDLQIFARYLPRIERLCLRLGDGMSDSLVSIFTYWLL